MFDAEPGGITDELREETCGETGTVLKASLRFESVQKVDHHHGLKIIHPRAIEEVFVW